MFLSKLNPFLVSGVVKDHVIEYFLNNIIGNKDKLKVRILPRCLFSMYHGDQGTPDQSQPDQTKIPNLGVDRTRIKIIAQTSDGPG